jgi:PAS domain S-box-containing protein
MVVAPPDPSFSLYWPAMEGRDIDVELAESGLISRTVLEAAEAAGLGVAIADIGVPAPVLVYANEAVGRMVGLTAAEMMTRPPFELVEPTDLEEVRRRLAIGMNGEPFEIRMLHSAGKLVPVQVAPCTVVKEGRTFAVTFFLDLSARRQAEHASLASEARFKRLIEGAPDGIAISKRGAFVYVNPAAAKLLGESADQLIGKSIASFLDEAGRRTFVERLASSKPGERTPPTEYLANRPDGSSITAEIVSMPFEWEGEPALIAFARDVTDRARVAAQLKRADRLASLGTLAAGVAHEINNPLTFMTLGVELLSKRINGSILGEDERAAMLATLADLRKGAARVADIVRDLRTFSRADDDARSEIDLSEVMQAAERMVDHRARHFATTHVSLGDLPTVIANASRLEQVFVNLLLNACQAFDEGRPENKIDVRGGTLPDERVYVDVCDNGPGIPGEILARIFDPFFTTKPVGEGTGLGLAICHGIVSQMGGEITAESRPGATRFRVTLPRRPQVGAMAVPPAAPSVNGVRLRVLVVDDEPSVVRVIQRTLSGNHDVETAGSVSEALALIEARPFDAVLCDLAMPGTSGVDLFERARHLRPELESHFVVMTGGAVSPHAHAFLDAWKGPQLDKPFSTKRLEQVLREAAGASSPAR